MVNMQSLDDIYKGVQHFWRFKSRTVGMAKN